MDALFNNAGPSYLPPACKIVFIKCCAYYTTSPTMTHLHWCACPGWPAPAARGPRPRPGAQGAYYPRQGSLLLPSSLPVLHSGSEQPPVLALLCCGHYSGSEQSCTRAPPHCKHSSEGLLRAGSCNANMLICLEFFLVRLKIERNPRKVLFIFILLIIALALP